MNSDEHVQGILKKGASSLIGAMAADTKDKSKKNQTEIELALAFLALIAVVGTEPLKVLLRRNVGKSALGIYSIVIASILYGICACFMCANAGSSDLHSNFGEPLFVAGGFFYGLLAIGTLVCGSIEYSKAKDNVSDYRGDSVFFGFLLDRGVSQKKVWTRYEPLTCIAISLFLMLLHPFIGLPLLVTSISFLFNEWFKVQYSPQIQKDRVARMKVVSKKIQPSFSSTEEYHEVN